MQRKAFCEKFPAHCDKYDSLDKLARFVEEKSKVINITSIRNYEDIWQKHIVDSLMLSKVEEARSKLEWNTVSVSTSTLVSTSTPVSALASASVSASPRVLDIGTGGGFPGLPHAICYPNLKFTLLDSTRKKVEVVKEFSSELGLKNIEAVWARADELAKDPKYKGEFDIVIARAVAYLPDLLNACTPFINENGSILLYKKLDEKELKESHKVSEKLGLCLSDRYEYKLDGDENPRVIYVYRKK